MFLNIDKKPANSIAAVDDKNYTVTYGELCIAAQEFGALSLRRGIVFVLCQNTIGALYAFYACIENRVVPLLLDGGMDMQLFLYLFTQYQPQYLCLPDEQVFQFPQFKQIYKKQGYTFLQTSYRYYLIHEELSMLLTTSGTTGSPKLVRHTYNNIQHNAKNVADVFAYTEDDCGMASLPMQYTMGLSVICSHLYAGAKIALTDYSLTTPAFWDFFESQHITDFTGVPFSYEVLDKLRFFRTPHAGLRILAEGGGRLSDELFQKVADYAVKNKKQFYATFGTTETTARLAYLKPALAIKKIGSIGQAIPGGELFLLDENGEEIKKNEASGELGYRGPNVTMGYAIKREDLILGDERHGMYLTGDMAGRDRDGCYYITGRKSRFLKLFGLRVSLDQCERLIQNEFKTECACTGDDKKMKIYVNCGINTDKVAAFISKKTGIFYQSFEISVMENLPRTESGKIKYALLS